MVAGRTCRVAKTLHVLLACQWCVRSQRSTAPKTQRRDLLNLFFADHLFVDCLASAAQLKVVQPTRAVFINGFVNFLVKKTRGLVKYAVHAKEVHRHGGGARCCFLLYV